MNSLVGRSLLVIAIAVLPALGGQIWSALQAEHAREHGVYDDALLLTRLVAADQQQMAGGARQALAAAGGMRASVEAGPACDALLADLLPRLHGYVSVASAGTDGRIDCSAGLAAPGVQSRARDASGEAWFRLALERGFASVAVTGAGTVVVTLAEPWRDHAGQVAGVVAVSLSRSWLNDRLRSVLGSEDAVAALLAGDGEVLARSDGRIIPEPGGAFASVVRLPEGGAAEMLEVVVVNEVRHLVGTSPIGAPPWRLVAAVAIDRKAAFAAASRAGEGDLALLLAGLAAALVTTLLATSRLVCRPMRRLLETAAAWAGGDLTARAGLQDGPHEFRRLAAAFDDMAAALQARELALRNALESTGDGVVVLDRDGRFTFLNTPAAALLGPGRDLRGQRLWDTLPGAADTALRALLDEALASFAPCQVEVFEPTLRRRLDVHAYPSPGGLTVRFRDVTEQWGARARAAEHDALLRVIAEAIPSLVYVTDPLGCIVYVNRRFQEFSGLPAARLLADGWRCLLHPDEAARVAGSWRESIEQETPHEVEQRLRAVDGTWHWFLSRGAPLRDSDGRIEYWYGVCVGIDEIVAARTAQTRQGEILERLVAERTAELHAREAQLAHAQKMEAVGQLTGGVAHDFNNLLQAVSGNLELAVAALGRSDPARVRRLLGNAARAISRGARLTGQLLAFSRRQVLRAECIDVRRLIDDMADLVRRAAGETVFVTTEGEPDLWPCRADPAQLEAAILNLVINARDAMPSGGALTVSLGNACLDAAAAEALGLPPGDFVRVAVGDTGTGMSQDVLSRAFEPFFTTKEVGRGSGLGLAQVHGFASQSGGSVRIGSNPGEGTLVTMYFPRDNSALGPAPAESPPWHDPGRGARVLLVEDDPEVLDTLQFALIDAGFCVVPARDGSDALTLLRSDKKLDLVLSDVVLPGGISGIDVGRLARRMRPELPVLLTSGDAGEMLARQAAEAGFELIAKPYPQSELLARIAGLVRRMHAPA